MRKLFYHLKPYRVEAVLGPLFKMLEALFELFIPLIVADIVDVGIRDGDSTYIWKKCGVMFLLGAIGLCCSITAQYFSAKAAVGVATGLRRELFAHIGKLSFAETDRFGTATLLSRSTADINHIQNTVNMVLRLFLRSPFIVFGAMIMSFRVSPSAAITFVIAIPLLSVVIFGIMLVSIPLFHRVQGKLDRVLELTRENLTGTRVIRAFAREDATYAQFRENNQELTHLQRFTGRLSALLNPMTYVIINLSIMMIIWRGGVQVQLGNLQQGEVLALYNYMSQILVELIKMANFIILITKAFASVARVNEVLETPAGMPASGHAAEPTESGTVEFRNVSLHYAKEAEAVLSHISLSASRGEVIGIIGGTGSGKSSLVNLIPRLYDVSEGQVLVDGTDVRDYGDPAALRARIGLVPQKAELFAGTIRDNLKFGNDGASDELLFAALDAAVAGEFVRAKEGSLDFVLEQGGRNLSGGQKQRLTIARALVRQPEILILDDSASALDLATDAKLRASIAALPYHPTVFIVSQRTAALNGADRILVLEDGSAVGYGKHEELLESCQVYKEIYESQFRSKGVSA